MATIHHTTLTPSKLDLLTRWLPRQLWYRGTGAPTLAKAPEGLSLHVVRVPSEQTSAEADVVGAVEADITGVGRRPILFVRRR